MMLFYIFIFRNKQIFNLYEIILRLEKEAKNLSSPKNCVPEEEGPTIGVLAPFAACLRRYRYPAGHQHLSSEITLPVHNYLFSNLSRFPWFHSIGIPPIVCINLYLFKTKMWENQMAY